MRYFSLAAIAVAGLLALPALAQPPRERGERGDRPGREEMRERMLKEFDKDGDGKLSDEERQAAREAMRERLGRRGEERRRGPGGPREQAGGPPRLTALFDKFDADGDGKLSRKEFGELAEFIRSQRPGPPGGPRFDGPPRGERRPEREGRPRRPRPDNPPAESDADPDEAI